MNLTDGQREAWDVDFSVSKSMRYHAYLRSYWDAFDHWNKVLILISGAAIVVSHLKDFEDLEEFVAFVVGILAVLDIVFSFSEHARKHDSLYRQFCNLASDIAAKVNPTAEDIAGWRARRLAIEMEEPGVWEWVNRRCYREEAKARGSKKDEIDKLLAGL